MNSWNRLQLYKPCSPLAAALLPPFSNCAIIFSFNSIPCHEQESMHFRRSQRVGSRWEPRTERDEEVHLGATGLNGVGPAPAALSARRVRK